MERSVPDWSYSRSELFFVWPGGGAGNPPRVYFTPAERVETVVGIRCTMLEDVAQYPIDNGGTTFLNGYAAPESPATSTGFTLTLCDAEKNPLIEGYPVNRLAPASIRLRAGAAATVQPVVPFKMKPQRVNLAASFISRQPTAPSACLVELFYA